MNRRAVARRRERHGGDSGVSSAALFPLVLAALLAYALAAPSLAPARALGLPDAANPTLVLLGAVAIFYPIVAGLERWRPERPEWRRPKGDVRADALHLVLTGPGSTALFDATLRGAAVATGPRSPSGSAGARGAPRAALLSYSVFAAEYGQLQHANVRLRTGPLDYAFSTPGLHRWHHSTDPRAGNSNYGAILSI